VLLTFSNSKREREKESKGRRMDEDNRRPHFKVKGKKISCFETSMAVAARPSRREKLRTRKARVSEYGKVLGRKLCSKYRKVI
jgi:hypothetical protein